MTKNKNFKIHPEIQAKGYKTNIYERNIKRFAKIFLPLIIILAVAISCYSGLLTYDSEGYPTHMIKWDIRDFTYPMFIYNSDSIRNFIFPLWDPYTFSGKPYFSDPQTCLFQPLTLLIIILKGYSLEVLQFHLFWVFFIAGVAMYFCLRSFLISIEAALVGAISFLGCGYFVGNAEHFTNVNMLALLPLSFMAINKVIGTESISNTAKGAVTITLLAFCGYPAMFIVCLYFIFAFGMLKILFIDDTAMPKTVSRKFLRMFVFFLLGISAASVVLLPSFAHTMLSTRSEGVSLYKIVPNSLHPAHLANIFFPFMATKGIPSLTLDISLRNCSFGIMGVFLAIYFLFFDKSRLKYSLFLLLALFLVLTMGTILPSYALVIKWIPFLKHIRHPTLVYRGVFLFLLCICSGFGAENFFRSDKSAVIKNGFFVFFFMVLLMVEIAWAVQFAYGSSILSAVLHEPFILFSMFFLLAVILSSQFFSKRWLILIVILFCILDVSHWVKANFFTVADPVPHEAWSYVRKQESQRNKRVDNNAVFQRHGAKFPISVKEYFALVNKYFSIGGYDPLILRYYSRFVKSPRSGILTEDFRILPISEVLILSDEEKVLDNLSREGIDLHKVAFINEKDIKNKTTLQKLRDLPLGLSNNFSSKLLHYGPNSIEYEIKTNIPLLLFFNEIYYPGWKLLLDGNKVDTFRINYVFRGAYVTAGEHHLKMYFSPGLFKIGFLISILTIAFMILLSKKHRSISFPRQVNE